MRKNASSSPRFSRGQMAHLTPACLHHRQDVREQVVCRTLDDQVGFMRLRNTGDPCQVAEFGAEGGKQRLQVSAFSKVQFNLARASLLLPEPLRRLDEFAVGRDRESPPEYTAPLPRAYHWW